MPADEHNTPSADSRVEAQPHSPSDHAAPGSAPEASPPPAASDAGGSPASAADALGRLADAAADALSRTGDAAGGALTPLVDAATDALSQAASAAEAAMDAGAIDRAMEQSLGSAGSGSAGSGSAGSEGGATGAGRSDANAAQPAPKKFRGPRVVQAGREHRKGTVVSVGEKDVFIEFGPKELGVVERQAWKDGDELPGVGSEIEVVVNKFEENLFVCTLPGTVEKAAWEGLAQGQVVEATVTGVNKGGLELEVAGHRAFMPAGQVDLYRIEDLSVFVNQKITCKVTRLDRRGAGNIVCSRREILAAERAKEAEKLKESLEEGQTLDGTVKKIMPFGVFVDIGGVDGLVHVSDLTHERVGMGEKAIERIVKSGDKVRVQVLSVDWEQNRISLGMKQLEENPYQAAMDEIVEGAEVSGRVKNIATFGAFVELAPGVEGLVHISELDWKRVENAADVVKPDEVITVKVLKVDPDSGKISLSLKQMKEAPERPQGGRGGAGGGAGGGRGGSGGGFGGGRGRGRGDRPERDTRSPDEILQETPQLRRLREKAKAKLQSGPTGGLVRNDTTFLEPDDDGQPKANKPAKQPAQKRKKEDAPKVEGLDSLLDKFGGGF